MCPNDKLKKEISAKRSELKSLRRNLEESENQNQILAEQIEQLLEEREDNQGHYENAENGQNETNSELHEELNVLAKKLAFRENELEKIFRTQLSELAGKVIKSAFTLLGIGVPERM